MSNKILEDYKGLLESDIMSMSTFKRLLKSEVDKANKRLKRMNDFQKSIFADKGITHISRAGDIREKLRALSQARIVNESGISTKREYTKYVKNLSDNLSLTTNEVDFMLNQFDSSERDFISKSPLKYGSNPQIDFLFEDVLEVNDSIKENMKKMKNEVMIVNNLTNEVVTLIQDL